MKIKINDYIANFLSHQKVDYVFEMAGGMITQLLDAIYKLGKTQIVSMHHEQAVAFAADAYGRCTGKTGVGFATSGPGATNLLTGIGSCFFDSSPALFITGQVNIHEQKGNSLVRQLGFQETDIVAMAAPIVKKSYRVTTAEQLPQLLQEAYTLAINGRPGPVLIDLPMNVQRMEIEISSIPVMTKTAPLNEGTENPVQLLLDALRSTKRPLILAGRGVNAAFASQDFLALVEALDIPVVTTLLGVDTIEYEHPLRVGFIGSYGNRWANMALGTADVLIVLGSRLDIRQTGADVESFAKGKTIFHIDCDPSEINNRVKNCIPIVKDVKDFIVKFQSLLKKTPLVEKPQYQEWKNTIADMKKQWPDTAELKNISGINPNVFMHLLSNKSQTACGYVIDVGNHQMWAAQSLEIQAKQFFMTSGGMGAMGFSLPAGIGASFSCQKRPVVVIAGDGSFQVNIQELETVVRNQLPLKIIVINNNSLGMIRQFQDSYFESRYQSTVWGYSAPNFELIAHAYGIPAKTLSQPNEMQTAIDWLWQNPNEPALLQVLIDINANAYPKIAFGKPITEMEPFSQPIQMEST